MSGLKLGRAHFLNGTEEATRGFTFKVLKRIGNVEVRIRHDDFVIEMNCRTNEFCQEGNDSLYSLRFRKFSFERARCFFLC